jgi:phenylacetate-CoA ligase
MIERALSDAAGDRLRRIALRRAMGRDIAGAASLHQATQWYPSEALAAMQWEQVSALVGYARTTNEFYRSRLEEVTTGPAVTPAAFRRIPPLRRGDVARCWAGQATRSAGAGGVLQRRSGGSSGEAVRIPLDRATYSWYIGGTWRGLGWWGADITRRGAVLLGSGGAGVRRLALRAKDWAMDWLRITVEDGFDEAVPAALVRLAAFRPVFLYGYPSAVHRLARAVAGRRAAWTGRLRVIALTGEPVYAFQRRAIEEAFACPVAEEYGNGELGSMAFECPEGTLHATVENVFLEVEPPATNGSGGPILATQLHNRRLPLIRYETGDWGNVGPSACACGRALPAVRVAGRTQERLVTASGSVLARPRLEELFSVLPDDLRGAVQIVHRPGGPTVCRVEHAQDRPSPDLRHIALLAAKVLGTGGSVDAVAVSRLPRLASGKLPYFVILRSDDDGSLHHE